MSEEAPKFTPEEKKLHSERGGYVSGQSRRGEIERGESGEWELTEKGRGALHEKALEEDEARGKAEDEKPFIPGPVAEIVEKTEEKSETKETAPEELKNAYFEWRDLERKAKGGSAWRLHVDQEKVLAAERAKEKYHQLLAGLTSEKTSKGFYLPEEMAPEGGPKKFNEERLEKMVEAELAL